LYQNVLEHKLDWLEDVVRAKRPRRLPVILTQDEVGAFLAQIDGINGLVAHLLYGTGMWQMECLRLRVKDVDFHYRQIHVRSGKGDKDRVTILLDQLVDDLRFQINKAYQLHQRDLSEGFG
jgi:integrase